METPSSPAMPDSLRQHWWSAPNPRDGGRRIFRIRRRWQVFGLAGTGFMPTYWPSLPGAFPVLLTAVVPAHRCGTVPEFHRVPSHPRVSWVRRCSGRSGLLIVRFSEPAAWARVVAIAVSGAVCWALAADGGRGFASLPGHCYGDLILRVSLPEVPSIPGLLVAAGTLCQCSRKSWLPIVVRSLFARFAQRMSSGLPQWRSTPTRTETRCIG